MEVEEKIVSLEDLMGNFEKYIFSEENIGNILKEGKKNKKKYNKKPTTISISTKLDSNDDDSN